MSPRTTRAGLRPGPEPQLVVLEGGPAALARLHRLPAGRTSETEKISVEYYGKHHHFQRTGRTDRIGGEDVPVFRWTYSTAIAE